MAGTEGSKRGYEVPGASISDMICQMPHDSAEAFSIILFCGT